MTNTIEICVYDRAAEFSTNFIKLVEQLQKNIIVYIHIGSSTYESGIIENDYIVIRQCEPLNIGTYYNNMMYGKIPEKEQGYIRIGQHYFKCTLEHKIPTNAVEYKPLVLCYNDLYDDLESAVLKYHGKPHIAAFIGSVLSKRGIIGYIVATPDNTIDMYYVGKMK